MKCVTCDQSAVLCLPCTEAGHVPLRKEIARLREEEVAIRERMVKERRLAEDRLTDLQIAIAEKHHLEDCINTALKRLNNFDKQLYNRRRYAEIIPPIRKALMKEFM